MSNNWSNSKLNLEKNTRRKILGTSSKINCWTVIVKIQTPTIKIYNIKINSNRTNSENRQRKIKNIRKIRIKERTERNHMNNNLKNLMTVILACFQILMRTKAIILVELDMIGNLVTIKMI